MLCILLSVVVDQAVSKDAVEPRDRRFVFERVRALDGFGKGRLQDLFGRLARSGPPLQEREKAMMTVKQQRQNVAGG